MTGEQFMIEPQVFYGSVICVKRMPSPIQRLEEMMPLDAFDPTLQTAFPFLI